MTPAELRQKWETEIGVMQRRGVLVNGATVCAELLADVEAVFRDQSEAPLTLTEGSRRSGYSVDHLAKMIREGKLRNIGRKGSPRIRAGDLPRKPPRKLARSAVGLYDPDADARDLLCRQRGERHE